MSILANITEAAAAFLVDSLESRGFGVELRTLDDKAIARELVTEGFGVVNLECPEHGADEIGWPRGCNGEMTQVFRINDAGIAWLDDAGKLV